MRSWKRENRIHEKVKTKVRTFSLTMDIKIYTDGGVSMKNKIGGWGCAIFIEGSKEILGLQGFERGEDVTNNTMEFRACIEALKWAAFHHIGANITIISDSEYIVKGVNEWSAGWVRKGWRCSTGKVKNKELWIELLGLKQLTRATFSWVKGHAGDKGNELADKLAVSAYKEQL